MSVKISRILHAGYIFEAEGFKIAFDPIFENPFSRNCYAFPEVRFVEDKIVELQIEAVFISHHHDDHCSLESLNKLDRATAIYLYCIHPVLFDWIKELGFVNVNEVTIGTPITTGPFIVTARRALDEDIDCIFHIQAHGIHVLNIVDSWIHPTTLLELEKSAPWDLVLWPFQTLRELEVLAPSRSSSKVEIPPEWFSQLAALKPCYVIASSCQFQHETWSWYNRALFPISYARFCSEVGLHLPQANIFRLNPSCSIELRKGTDNLLLVPAAALDILQPIGDQDVDYKFDENCQPQSLAEIARQLTSADADSEPVLKRNHLSGIELKEEVLSYCEQGLLEKYRSLPDHEEGYFKQPRNWRLLLYDELGKPHGFLYRIFRQTISLIESGETHWQTEVPIVKVYAALKNGETLTSMYLRINHLEFDDKTEQQLAEVDRLSDPLVRCLFDGEFGSYQYAQLLKIRERRGRH